MKTKLVVTVILASFLIFTGCSNDDDNGVQVEPIPDLINPTFPEAQQEVMETFGAIAQSIIDGDMDKLIAFHAYSPKFTEFKKGEPRNDGATNEAYERATFGAVTEVLKFEANDLQIAVYGYVANLTFHSDFHLMFGSDLFIVNDQITLLFVKTNNGWKMVHEHHSPLNN